MADKALLMGVNKYKYVSPLRGCENDVKNIRDLLIKELKFPEKNIRTLLTAEVVKKEVLRQMKWLFEGTGPGDRVLLHFSGHGSYTIDLDGDEDTTGPDELICLYDMSFDDKNSYLLDDELRAWTRTKPDGVQLVVILDNCHSGTGTKLVVAPSDARGLSNPTGMLRVIEKETRERTGDRALSRDLSLLAVEAPQNLVLSRFVEPPDEIVSKAARSLQRRQRNLSTMIHVLLAACSDQQTAADAYINSRYQGAFSYYLGKIIRSYGADISRNTLLQQLRTEIGNSYSQTPQVEASLLTGPLFGNDNSGGSHRDDFDELAGNSTSAILREILTTLQTVSRKLDHQLSDVGFGPRDTSSKALVYVHGIGVTAQGYSQTWWNSLEPHAPSLTPGTLGTVRHEVFWGDIVNRDLAFESSREADEMDRLRDQLEATLRDRRAATAPTLTETDAREMRERGFTDDIQNFLGLPQIDDFLRYLASDSVRANCIARFTSKVEPLLRAGRQIEIISHSWGTVVAYEGLRELEELNLPGRVHNFFTVGAALSISMIAKRLKPANRDQAKPALVDSWTNLDAEGDLVGGSLRAIGFDVDNDFVRLTPTGCQKGFFGYNLVCAHSSYFNAANLDVNRKIFGRFIERA